MKVLMSGGGTAGHVNPALAIADTIKRYNKDACIEFVSSNMPTDKAVDLVTRAGYKLHKVDICGSHRIYDPRNIKTLYCMLKSAKQARRIIEDFKPDIIIGTGGYASYPVLNEGAKMGIPTLVHESNAIAGKAVKRLAPRVDCVMTNFQSTAEELRCAKRVIRVGNPSLFDDGKGRGKKVEAVGCNFTDGTPTTRAASTSAAASTPAAARTSAAASIPTTPGARDFAAKSAKKSRISGNNARKNPENIGIIVNKHEIICEQNTENVGFSAKVLSFGGSGGSETMNDGVLSALRTLADKFPDVEFYHASGKRDYERMKSEFSLAGLDKKPNVVLTDYIYDMDARMAEADLLICRAGAMTVSETALLGKAVIFIPSPYVAANHQYKNAKAIYDKGACFLVEEREFASGKLEKSVEKLLLDKVLRATLGENIRAFAEPDANEKIYLEIKNLLKP